MTSIDETQIVTESLDTPADDDYPTGMLASPTRTQL